MVPRFVGLAVLPGRSQAVPFFFVEVFTMAVTGMVYFCPDLRLYRYKVDDSAHPENAIDSKFDADELEDAVVAQLAEANRLGGDDRMARFLSNMTGMARVNPHKIVTFNVEDDKAKIVEPADYWKRHDAERDARDARDE